MHQGLTYAMGAMDAGEAQQHVAAGGITAAVDQALQRMLLTDVLPGGGDQTHHLVGMRSQESSGEGELSCGNAIADALAGRAAVAGATGLRCIPGPAAIVIRGLAIRAGAGLGRLATLQVGIAVMPALHPVMAGLMAGRRVGGFGGHGSWPFCFLCSHARGTCQVSWEWQWLRAHALVWWAAGPSGHNGPCDAYRTHFMAPSTDTPPAGNLDLLRILCCVAWSDGEFSAEERELLQDLVERYGVTDGGVPLQAETAEKLAGQSLQPEALDELVSRLDSDEDRQLALKLGYMMIRVGRRPGDESSINPMEKLAYRRLVEGLGLGEADIAEAEWAAELDLQAQTGLKGFLSRHFGFLLP